MFIVSSLQRGYVHKNDRSQLQTEEKLHSYAENTAVNTAISMKNRNQLQKNLPF